MLLLLAANGAPILTARLLHTRCSLALDMGYQLADGRPLFGSSKTWRGLFSTLLVCSLLAPLLGYSISFGLWFGALVMTGDLVSSFFKRRLGLLPSARCVGLDQLPEAILPALYALQVLDYSWLLAVPMALAFMLLDMLLSRPLFLLHIRKRPY